MRTALPAVLRPSLVLSLAVALAAAAAVKGADGPGVTQPTRFPPADADMVWIPAGTFTMGCAPADSGCFEDERPRHQVTLSRGFWMDVTEVTVGQFRRFASATGRTMPPPPSFAQGDNQPVVNVTWDDSVAYCGWAGGRLPTEAEWEYAARGGTDGALFPTGNLIGHDQANFEGVEGRDRWVRTSPVASFEANAFGLFDMAGNVWEWCADFYDPHLYTAAPAVDPRGPANGSLRAIRGGSWSHGRTSLRCSNRGKFSPAGRVEFFGFRCVRDAEPLPPDVVVPAGRVASPGPGSEQPSSTGSQPGPTASSTTSILVAPAGPSSTPIPFPNELVPRTAPPPAAAVGQRRQFPPADGEMVWIPAATFEMGAVRGDGAGFADEQPRHTVTLTHGFWIGVTEVTFAQYRTFATATGRPMPSLPNWADEAHPVVNVTWADAVAYCTWAGGRLPTEAEWEYAARGGESGLKYPWGNEITHDNANFDSVGGRDVWAKSSPVASFAPNGFGLFDVAGNVWEWCADWYGERYYGGSLAVDPKGPEHGQARVVRGGCWTSDPGRLRASYRFSLDPSDTQVSAGFRCVRDGGQ